MTNSKVNLDLTRGNVCDILRAITSVRVSFMAEIADESTSEDRREVAKSSLNMWNKLRDEIKIQLAKHDAGL